MSAARYRIERWPHGWLFCGPSGERSIPLTALSECEKLFPKDAVMDMGIPHHFKAAGRREVVCCVARVSDAQKWRAEILQSIAGLEPEVRWWRGLDVGTSSAALFAVLCQSDNLRHAAKEMGQESVPRDSADFGRCVRLLEHFPEWRERLQEVGLAYPLTKWPEIIARWDEIAKSDAVQMTKILNSL